MAIVRVERLSKSYLISEKQPGLAGSLKHLFARTNTSVRAVDNISFEIEAGEIVGFIGSNGAGKTTTLKMLCGLIHPTSGSISVSGYKPIHRKTAFLKNITLVMGQKQQLIWDLPALDSLHVNASVYGISDTDRDERIEELSAMLDLKDELNRPVRKLSLGERMKCELLASLIHRPSILFLDEPTLGLDINAQIRVREFLREYNKKYRSTVILTSHYMGDIKSLCKRIILINNGRIFYDGLLATLTKTYSSSSFISIELTKAVNPVLFKEFGEIIECDELLVRLLVPRSSLKETLFKLLNQMPIKDLEVNDPPTEQIIAKLLRSVSL